MCTHPTFTVAILENNAALRLGYRNCLETDDRLHLVHEGGLDWPSLQLFTADCPDLVIVGLGRGRRRSLAFLQDMNNTLEEVKVLVVSPHRSSMYARKTFFAGADGYVCWSDATNDLLPAAQSILAGKPVFPEEFDQTSVLDQRGMTHSRQRFADVGEGF